MDLTDVYRVFHPATAQYVFFSAVDGNLSKIDHTSITKQVLKSTRKLK
jgi:hypothetical protein